MLWSYNNTIFTFMNIFTHCSSDCMADGLTLTFARNIYLESTGLWLSFVWESWQSNYLHSGIAESRVNIFFRLRALPIQYLDLPAQGIRMKLNEVRLAAGKKYWTLDVMNAMGNEISNKQLLACLKVSFLSPI